MNYRDHELKKIWEKLCEHDKLPQVDKWLAAFLKKDKRYGSSDRKFYSDSIFDLFRYSHCDSWEELKNQSWQKISEHTQEQKKLPPSIKLIPKNFRQKFLERFPENSDETKNTIRHIFLEKMLSRPPLWLRINRTTAAAVAESLRTDGLEVEVISSEALAVTGRKGIYETTAFKAGLFEIQDLASQLAGNYVQCKPGEGIWDACAGGGGKTMQIAAKTLNKGFVYASDIREYKFSEIQNRAKRAQFFNVRTVLWQGETLPAFGKEVANKSGFDWVLVDAPCSASGTWRRNPDAKYLNLDLDALAMIQKKLLQNASEAVKSQGHLVYITCSWIRDENEGIIQNFLAANPEFELIKMELLGNPYLDSDTLFAAVMKKIK